MYFLFFTVVWGLLAAAVLQAIFHHVMDFRAQWFDTLFAAVLAGGMVGVANFCTDWIFSAGAEPGLLKILGFDFIVAFAVGLLAFRFMIKSEAGNFLSWGISAAVALGLVAVPLMVRFLMFVAT